MAYRRPITLLVSRNAKKRPIFATSPVQTSPALDEVRADLFAIGKGETGYRLAVGAAQFDEGGGVIPQARFQLRH